MRSDILTYLRDQALGSYTLTTELPWENNDTPLYLSNLKRVYVDLPQITQEMLYDTMGSLSGARDVVTETVSISVFVANDAKTLPQDYEQLIQTVKNVRSAPFTQGAIRRTCQVSTEMVSDRVVTTWAFSFTRITT